jgi:hypothetical protein
VSTVTLRSGSIWTGPRVYPTDDRFYELAAANAVPDTARIVLRGLAITFGVGFLALLAGPVRRLVVKAGEGTEVRVRETTPKLPVVPMKVSGWVLICIASFWCLLTGLAASRRVQGDILEALTTSIGMAVLAALIANATKRGDWNTFAKWFLGVVFLISVTVLWQPRS